MDIYISSGPWSFHYPWKWFINPNLFTGITSKSYTRYPNKGNPIWSSVRPIPGGGWRNRMGIPNKGMKGAAVEYHGMNRRWKDKFIPSIAIAPNGHSDDITKTLNYFHLAIPTVLAIEINISCPSVLSPQITEHTLREYREASPVSDLILKISQLTEISLIQAAVNLNYKIHASNSLRHMGESNRPWGISGNADAFITNTRTVERIRKECPGAIIIAGGGIVKVEDAEYYLNISGANAVSIGSVLLTKPWMANRIAHNFRNS